MAVSRILPINQSLGIRDSMDHKLIKNLEPGIRKATVRCCVSRIWDCVNPMSYNQLISVDMMFVDEEGTSIQATIRSRDAHWLRETVEEGSIYICTGFIVIAASNNYRVCKNPNIILLSRRTTSFKQCRSEDLLTFHVHSFSFVKYSALMERAGDIQILTDVIGQVTSMSPIEQLNVNNQPVDTRTIKLQNTEGSTISATLWTTVAHQINDYHVRTLMEKGCIIMILAATFVTNFKGQLTLSSKSATKVYMNLSDPATTSFKQALTVPKTMTFTPLGMTLEEQINHNRKTVAELLHLNPQLIKGIKFTCKTKIKDIHPFNGWWFPACPKCKRKVTISGQIYYCENCNTYIDDTPEHWYNLELVVQDHTADCVFMIVGRHAEILVGQTARDLALKNLDPYILPDAIKRLRGITKIFELELMYRKMSSLMFKVTRSFDATAKSITLTPTERDKIDSFTPSSENQCPKKAKLGSSSSDSTTSDVSHACTE